jgi:asparagine synthase (glutamine-hydrolysing)
MPGITGIVSKRPAEDCQRLSQAMVTSMEHESFYDSGMYSTPEMGIYAG